MASSNETGSLAASSDSAVTLLATIGDAALSLWDVDRADERVVLPKSLEAILSSYAPAPALSHFGGDCATALDLPCPGTENYWLHISVFALTAAVAAGEHSSVSFTTLGDLILQARALA